MTLIHFGNTRQAMTAILMVVAIMLFPLISYCQESAPGPIVICYGSNTNNDYHANNASARMRSNTSNAATANFEITFNGFPEAAKNAFQYAIDIWQTELQSQLPIRVNATWKPLENKLLATTRATKIYRGFEGAVSPDIWYPVSLAEKLAGKELNETSEADIEITVNSTVNWYLNTDGNTPRGYTDLATVVLHEIAHGLGFSSSAKATEAYGYLRDDNHLGIYDVLLETKEHSRLSTSADSTKILKSQLTSNSVFLYSPSSIIREGDYPKIFAPSQFINGSSISHLDEATYPEGTVDALMTPYFSMNESIHSPGTILMGVLNDMGWGDETGERYAVSVYPNPGTGVFNLQIQMPITESSVAYSVTDVCGRTVIESQLYIQQPTNTLDLSQLPSGMYILTMLAGSTSIVNRIVVQR